ncbi:hypothetical protein L596_003263 [Steinernema carpocapsae]|uniref:t-SNARE coiled-coil homology domain-containing protein n=1 Tax=Steinernema carpocapsae TaxID=34508 RepID=A0A4U8UVZ8_STECR|nr:hypothetical protein L596_003263 [Steinernema carpocapsae]
MPVEETLLLHLSIAVRCSTSTPLARHFHSVLDFEILADFLFAFFDLRGASDLWLPFRIDLAKLRTFPSQLPEVQILQSSRDSTSRCLPFGGDADDLSHFPHAGVFAHLLRLFYSLAELGQSLLVRLLSFAAPVVGDFKVRLSRSPISANGQRRVRFTIMTKDRLGEFPRHLSSGSSEKSLNGLAAKLRNDMFAAEQQRLLDSETNPGLLEAFFADVETINEELDIMETALKKMQAIHSKILLEPGVHSQYTEELSQHVDQFKNISKTTRARLDVMKANVGDADPSASSSRIRQNQIIKITKRLYDILGAFNNEQVRYREKCKHTITKFLAISDREMPEDDIDLAIESGRIFDFTKGMMLAHHDKQILYEDVKSRHEDILRLENSIRELHEIFQDMAMLVESQGQIIDNIENNVGAAVDYASRARGDVKKALAAQRGSRKKKIILLIFCIIFVMVAFFVGSSLFCVYVPICGR